MKTVLVTGGAGFIGSHLVDRLLARGDRVVVVDDFNDFYEPQIKRDNLKAALVKPNCQLVEADIREAGLFEKLFGQDKIDVVVHLAARAGVRNSLADPLLYWQVNVDASIALMEAMVKHKVAKLVFASSSSVYGDRDKGPFVETDRTDAPISPYGASKKALEVAAYAYHQLYGMEVTGLRFFTVYGPRMRPDLAIGKFMRAIHTGEEIVQYGEGSTGRDYTYIDDIVEGVLAAVDHTSSYELVNLGNNSPVKLSEMIEAIESVVGKKEKVKIESKQPGDVELTYADIRKAARLWRWKPKEEFRSGLQKMYQWYKSQQR